MVEKWLFVGGFLLSQKKAKVFFYSSAVIIGQGIPQLQMITLFRRYGGMNEIFIKKLRYMSNNGCITDSNYIILAFVDLLDGTEDDRIREFFKIQNPAL